MRASTSRAARAAGSRTRARCRGHPAVYDDHVLYVLAWRDHGGDRRNCSPTWSSAVRARSSAVWSPRLPALVIAVIVAYDADLLALRIRRRPPPSRRAGRGGCGRSLRCGGSLASIADAPARPAVEATAAKRCDTATAPGWYSGVRGDRCSRAHVCARCSRRHREPVRPLRPRRRGGIERGFRTRLPTPRTTAGWESGRSRSTGFATQGFMARAPAPTTR